MENLVDDNDSDGLGIVTFPDDPQPEDMQLDLQSALNPEHKTNGRLQQRLQSNGISNLNGLSTNTVKFEQKRSESASKTKISNSNGFSREHVNYFKVLLCIY